MNIRTTFYLLILLFFFTVLSFAQSNVSTTTNESTNQPSSVDTNIIISSVSNTNENTNTSFSNESSLKAEIAGETKEVYEGPMAGEKEMTYFEETFKYGTPTQQKEAILKIRREKYSNAIDLIVKHYSQTRNPDVKKAILTMFTYLDDNRAKDVISFAIEDENTDVKKLGYKLLGYYPDIRFEKSLLEGMSNSDPLLRVGCISALGEIASTNAVKPLLELYEDVLITDDIRGRIIEALGKIGVKEAESLIKEIIEDVAADKYLKYYAIVALGEFPSKDNYDIIRRLVEEDNAEMVARAIYVLPKFKDYGDISEDIMLGARSDSEKVRLFAVKALKENKSEEAKALLLYRLKNDSDITVRTAAVNSLEVYDDEEVIDALKKLALYGNNTTLQTAAKTVLEKKGVDISEEEKNKDEKAPE